MLVLLFVLKWAWSGFLQTLHPPCISESHVPWREVFLCQKNGQKNEVVVTRLMFSGSQGQMLSWLSHNLAPTGVAQANMHARGHRII